jgi:hypothetical protein
VLLQVRHYGRNGLQAQVLRLNIQPEAPSSGSSSSSSSSEQQQQQPLASVRVLPKEVHMNAVSLEVENFRFLFCPPDRLVRCCYHKNANKTGNKGVWFDTAAAAASAVAVLEYCSRVQHIA